MLDYLYRKMTSFEPGVYECFFTRKKNSPFHLNALRILIVLIFTHVRSVAQILEITSVILDFHTEEMKRAFHAKLGGKRQDKTSLNYRFTVHLAGKFFFSCKKTMLNLKYDFPICIFTLTSDRRSSCCFNI